jgi:uncharacterized protein (DUF488 family)
MRFYTAGHGARPAEELLATLRAADVETVVDVRRFPSSRRHPHFGQVPLAAALAEARIAYRHEIDLGGRRSGEPGEDRFACIQKAAFRSYAARMSQPEWQEALTRGLAEPAPCFLCAETLWWQCHRRFIAELLVARGHEVVHLIGPRERQHHRAMDEAEARDGRLYLCGVLVA